MFKHLFNVIEPTVAQPVSDVTQSQANTTVTQRQSLAHPGDDSNLQQASIVSSGVFVRFLLSDIKENTQFVECTIALLQFPFMDHVAMPYIERLSSRPHYTAPTLEQNAERQRIEPVSEQEVHAEQDEGRVQNDQIISDSSQMLDNNHVGQDLPIQENTQIRDTNYVRENNPVQNNTHEHAGADSDGSILDESMLSFTAGAMKFYQHFINALEEYMSCTRFLENGQIQRTPQECHCVKMLNMATVAINEINSVLGAFSREFLKLKRPLRIPESAFGHALFNLLIYHMDQAKIFFDTLGNSLPRECKLYWKNFSPPKESSITGIIQRQAQCL